MTEQAESSHSVDYAQRRRERASARRANRWKRVPVLGIGVGAAFVVALVVLEVALSWGRVHPGVTLAGVDVGGLRPQAAAARLETSIDALTAKPVTVVHGDASWTVAARDIGLSYDYESMVTAAMAVGRGDAISTVVGRARAWFGGVELAALPKTQRPRLVDTLDRIAKDIDVAPVDAGVSVSGTELQLSSAKDGVALRRGPAERAILSAMLSDKRVVEAPVGAVSPGVSDADADAARSIAAKMLVSGVTVTFDDKQWEFTAQDVAGWLTFRRSDEAPEMVHEQTDTVQPEPPGSVEVTMVAYISPVKVGKVVVPALGTSVGRPARNARFKTSSGQVTIVPSQEGIGPDLDRLAAELTSELPDETADRVVELHTTRSEPAITTEEAQAMGIKQRIARYTTTYDSGNTSRVNNIHLLGDSLDGKLIRPGATFSFNGAIGERTAAKGYQEANAIVNGKLVPQLGGGICQVGTTLFNTVYESGLPVVERRNHSFYISHYPKGRDATVSWGGPDLKFKNDTKNWILISVSYTSSSITIALYGTDPGYDIETEIGEWRNVKPFKTEIVKDPELLVGKKVVEDSGVTGRTITVKRTVYLAGEIVREDSFVSVYRPKTEVVRVGTKPKPVVTRPSTTTPVPTP